jgi:hypothetical protein
MLPDSAWPPYGGPSDKSHSVLADDGHARFSGEATLTWRS